MSEDTNGTEQLENQEAKNAELGAPDSGTEETGTEATEENRETKKWAGMYETPEVLESSFKSLQSEFTKKAQEAADLRKILSNLGHQKPEPTAHQEVDPLQELAEAYADIDPGISQLANAVREMRGNVVQQQVAAGLEQTVTVGGFLNDFQAENPALYTDATLGNEFVEYVDAMLRNYNVNFKDVVDAVGTNRPIHPNLARDFKKAVGMARKAVLGPVKSSEETKKKTDEAKKRTEKRVDTLGAGSTDTRTTQNKPASGSYRDAVRRAQSDSD